MATYFLFFLLNLISYCIFSMTIYFPYTSLPITITTLLSMPMSPFSFLLNLPTPLTPLAPHSCHPALYL